MAHVWFLISSAPIITIPWIETLSHYSFSIIAEISLNMSEKLCLQWNDFNANINKAFGNLRKDLDFTDVTLASDDGYQVEAHKVLLAASSPFFKDILVKNKHNHPLIYMRGVKAENMTAIVDFLYNGEANVSQELLDSF